MGTSIPKWQLQFRFQKISTSPGAASQHLPKKITVRKGSCHFSGRVKMAKTHSRDPRSSRGPGTGPGGIKISRKKFRNRHPTDKNGTIGQSRGFHQKKKKLPVAIPRGPGGRTKKVSTGAALYPSEKKKNNGQGGFAGPGQPIGPFPRRFFCFKVRFLRGGVKHGNVKLSLTAQGFDSISKKLAKSQHFRMDPHPANPNQSRPTFDSPTPLPASISSPRD